MSRLLLRLFRNKGCRFFYCSREVSGFVEGGYDGVKLFRIPYCEEHGELAKEVVKEHFNKSNL